MKVEEPQAMFTCSHLWRLLSGIIVECEDCAEKIKLGNANCPTLVICNLGRGKIKVVCVNCYL